MSNLKLKNRKFTSLFLCFHEVCDKRLQRTMPCSPRIPFVPRWQPLLLWQDSATRVSSECNLASKTTVQQQYKEKKVQTAQDQLSRMQLPLLAKSRGPRTLGMRRGPHGKYSGKPWLVTLRWHSFVFLSTRCFLKHTHHPLIPQRRLILNRRMLLAHAMPCHAMPCLRGYQLT